LTENGRVAVAPHHVDPAVGGHRRGVHAIEPVQAFRLEVRLARSGIEGRDVISREWNFDELMEKIWEYLDLLRIYTKPKGQIPDYEAPVIVPRKFSNIEGFCNKLHINRLRLRHGMQISRSRTCELVDRYNW
jgi:hypothetical protein